MNFTDEILQVGKDKATRLKSYLEELEVQMALGKAEARDAFEKEKKTFRNYMNSYQTKLAENENLASENRMNLNVKFAALDSLINQEFPTQKRSYDKFKRETLQAIHELEFGIKEAHGDVGLKTQMALDRFKDKLDTYRVQLALSEVKPEESLNNRKAELHEAIVKIQNNLNKEMEAGSKMDNFVEEVSESLDKMKKAFSDLFA